MRYITVLECEKERNTISKEEVSSNPSWINEQTSITSFA